MATLTATHTGRFAPVIRFRGAEYHSDGCVNLTDLTETRAEAVVSGSDDYRVELRDYAHAARMRSSCECPYFAEWGNCKHVWATLLAIEEVLADLEVASERIQASADGEPVALPAREVRPRAQMPARPAPVSPPPPAPRAPEWRQRLQQVLPRETDAERGSAPPVVEYYIEPVDPDLAAEGTLLTLEVRTRVRKKDGGLGVPRTGLLSADDLERLPAADRAVLQHYRRERGAWSYAYSYRETGGGLRVLDPWPLSRASAPTVLSLLATTGRVFRGPPGAHDPALPVQIDVAEPFRFELVVEDQTPAGRTRRIDGALRRGDETLPIELADACEDGDVLLSQGRLVRLDLGGGERLAREFATGGPLLVKAGELPEVLGNLARVRGAERFLARVVEQLPPAAPVPVVAALLPKAQAAPVTATVQFDYGGVLVPFGDGPPLVPGADELLRRDPAAEAPWFARALAAGLARDPAGRLQCARDRFAAVAQALVAQGFRVLAEGQLVRPFVGGQGSVRSAQDWFEVAGEVEFAGHRTTLPELLRRKLLPDGFVELGDGSFGMLPGSWVRRIEALRVLGGDADGAAVRLPSSQALLLDALLEARADDFAVDRRFQALRERLGSFRALEPRPEPAGFRGELRPYQRHGLGWLAFLRDFGLGGCLADDMGLGKTVQVLAHLVATAGDRGGRPNLLIAPRSVLPNWLAEAQRFAPGLAVLDFSQPDRWAAHGKRLGKHDLVLSTYGLLRTDAVRFAELGIRFHHAILDEAQAAKNAASQTAKAVRLLQADHRLALTGTPVENHLGELWSLFEFLNPGMLGRLPAFRGLFGKDVGERTLAEHRELLQRALRPVLLRRTKAQVLPDLPPKVEQTLWCELEPAQRRRYDELRAHYRRLLLDGGGELGDQCFVVLEALLRLRQAACHEGLLDPTKRRAGSAKLDALLPRLEELVEEGHKALVFSQFTAFLDLVEPELKERGIAFERLDGRTRDRAARVKRFQEDAGCPVFLISLKAGGFGLNLTAAGYVFVLDPWWNPAAEMQAIDRAHRIGQQKVVHALRLVCRGTVEEKVLELQAAKKKLCEAILGNERSLLQDLTREDLELLLG